MYHLNKFDEHSQEVIRITKICTRTGEYNLALVQTKSLLLTFLCCSTQMEEKLH